MKELLTYILENILDNSDQIEIKEEDNDGFINYQILAPKDQIGKIIGKNGRTINSIKNLLKIKAIKENKRVELAIAEKA